MALGAAPATPEQHRGDHQQADPGDDQHRCHRQTAAFAAALADVGQPGGGSGRRARPVAVSQGRFDAVPADVVDPRRTAAGRGGGNEEGVRALPGRHRQDRVVVTQIAGGSGLLRPTHRALGGEGFDEHHPQPYAALGVELIDRSLHFGELALVKHAGIVGDGVREPERRFCRDRRGQQGGGRQARSEQDRGEQTQKTVQAHNRQCSSPGRPRPDCQQNFGPIGVSTGAGRLCGGAMAMTTTWR